MGSRSPDRPDWRDQHAFTPKRRPGLLVVGSGMLVDDRGRVLMAKRSLSGTRPDLWEMPGGKIDRVDGGDLRETVRREWREELDLDILVGRYVATSELRVEVDIDVHLFEVNIVYPRSKMKLMVHSEARFVDLKHAVIRMPCAPATYDHYRAAMAALASRGRATR